MESLFVALFKRQKFMETYLKYIAIVAILNSLNIGKILQILFLRILYPKAGIQKIEKFIKNTKTKFKFPKLRK